MDAYKARAGLGASVLFELFGMLLGPNSRDGTIVVETTSLVGSNDTPATLYCPGRANLGPLGYPLGGTARSFRGHSHRPFLTDRQCASERNPTLDDRLRVAEQSESGGSSPLPPASSLRPD